MYIHTSVHRGAECRRSVGWSDLRAWTDKKEIEGENICVCMCVVRAESIGEIVKETKRVSLKCDTFNIGVAM